MIKEFLCVSCPNGCVIEAEVEGERLITLEGNLCARGEEYVKQELILPTRTIASSVLVSGGEIPLCSVRTTAPIPKERIFDVMGEIRALKLTAPVQGGQVLIADVLGLKSDIIATKTVNAI